MICYSQIDSPVGLLILKSEGEALTGIYMSGTYLDAPSQVPPDLHRWMLDPTAAPLWENPVLRRAGAAHRQSESIARSGPRQRPQSHPDRGAVPPGDRRERIAHRIRRWARAQALAARA